jgi:hypothetical protein
MKYEVSYDLTAPETVNDYKRLYKALNDLGAKKTLKSQWVLRYANTTASNISNHFWQFMDGNDRLFVTCLDASDWAGYNVITDPNTI